VVYSTDDATASSVLYTTQSSAPEDGRNYRPKHVELIEIINKTITVASSWLFILLYVVWQKSNETDFLLTMNFTLFTNQGYPLRNSSNGQLHSDGGVVFIVRSSAGRLLLEYLSARRLRSSGYYPKYQNGALKSIFLSQRNKKKSQGLRSGE